MARGREHNLRIFSAFLASAVEMVEALTIVLAAGVARGWRFSLAGAAAAAVVLAGIVVSGTLYLTLRRAVSGSSGE